MTSTKKEAFQFPGSWDNQLLRSLPVDESGKRTARQTPGVAASLIMPDPVAAPSVVACSDPAAELLGLSAQDFANEDLIKALAGNRVLEGMQPFALNYGGHQFGHWAGQLGDGRAISLGELVNAQGQRWELQLKGAGATPYSRGADGRAVLRSSLREFVCSEAMHALGVPTTRALSLVTTGEAVVRDMFYDGNPQAEPGAIVCRMAPSFIRFGNFELPAARGESELLEAWVDFCIARDFPHLHGPNKRADWFLEICDRTALMIAHWMRVGFVHGVMNTDNMSVLGLTIDYGPYGWMEEFDPIWTPNTTDAQGRRYCYGRQPMIGHWNLSALASAISAVIGDTDVLNTGLQRYVQGFEQNHRQMSLMKIGLNEAQESDDILLNDLIALMQMAHFDFTLFFRALTDVDIDSARAEDFKGISYASDYERHAPVVQSWLKRWSARVEDEAVETEQRRQLMHSVNPLYVPRNYLAQLCIDDAQQGDISRLNRWLSVLRQPYCEQRNAGEFAQMRPEWAVDRAGCSMLSCSS